jgi:HEAT repeat protein
MTNVVCIGIPARHRMAVLVLTVLLSAIMLAVGCGDNRGGSIDGIYALQADPTPENRARIRQALENPDHDIRATALHVLLNLGVEDGSELGIRFLGDEHPFVRMTAAILLGSVGDATAVDPLGDRLRNDEDWRVRQRAAESLAALGGEQAAIYLREGFVDPLMEVRRASIMGVATIAPADSMDGLILLLREDPEWEVRVQAARALGSLGLPEAGPALEEAVYEDSNQFVQAAAAYAMKLLDEKGI